MPLLTPLALPKNALRRREISHTYLEEKAPTPDDGGTTHSGECAICGGTFTQEHYGMETDNTCDGCGYEKKEVDTTPKEVVLDFVTNFDVFAEKWDSSYKNRTLTASDFGLSGIDLTCSMDANKQPSGNSIDDRPVTQKKNIVISLENANFVGKIRFEFKEWPKKSLGALTLTVTHDGVESKIEGGTDYTQEFDLSKYSGITKVALSSSNTGNVGVTKITLSYVTTSGGSSSGGGGESGGETGGGEVKQALAIIQFGSTSGDRDGNGSNDKTVYKKNGFTFTHLKKSATTNNRNTDEDHYRMYQSSTFELSGEQAFSKLIFKINSGKPRSTTALQTSINNLGQAGVTVSVDGYTVTVTFSTAVTSFGPVTNSAAAWIDSLEIWA